MADYMTQVRRSGVNPELLSERNKATFSGSEIAHFIDGGEYRTKRRKEFENILLSDPTFRIRDNIYKSNTELYGVAVAAQVKLFRMKRDQRWSKEDFLLAMRVIRGQISSRIQHTMFIPALERLATEEQKSKWLTPALNYEIMGSYAQTEIGHGTNLREIETTATFDKATDEFVLNTPKLSSMKWWPGALGKSSTHAILLAQLLIDGKKLGMNAFMVQLRSMKDHTLMPGIKCGVIGPKLGLDCSDNGFLFLDNVRIPRENMLMRNQQVNRNGVYTSNSPSQANYATMVYVRVIMVLESATAMSLATTAAIRYSAVRRQSSMKPGAPEMKVLDYQTQQYKLFPALASAYAFYFCYKHLNETYQNILAENQQGNFQNAQELHIISSGMKALITDLHCEHIETCRRSCGGHGYLRSAGISDVLALSKAFVTAEGESTVLYLQVAKYLIKQTAKLQSGQSLIGSTDYLCMRPTEYTCSIQNKGDCRRLDVLFNIYRRRAYCVVMKAVRKLQADIASGMEQDVAMNNNLQTLAKAAMAHCYVLVMHSYLEGFQSNIKTFSQPLRQVLNSLGCLFVTHYIITQSGEFLECGALGPKQLAWLQDQELELFAEIRPNAVALVDAFDIHDETLCSTIGSNDGWAYERLYESALKDPLNKNEVDPSYHNHLRKLLTENTSSKL